MGFMNYLWISIFHSIIASYLKHKAACQWCYRESILGEVKLLELEGSPNNAYVFSDIAVEVC